LLSCHGGSSASLSTFFEVGIVSGDGPYRSTPRRALDLRDARAAWTRVVEFLRSAPAIDSRRLAVDIQSELDMRFPERKG
jgi:hypothetical protein